ncbi:MAG: LCP family protein [Clostridia bacterium]|nr:LCP family protein [Clostridia bacterium]
MSDRRNPPPRRPVRNENSPARRPAQSVSGRRPGAPVRRRRRPTPRFYAFIALFTVILLFIVWLLVSRPWRGSDPTVEPMETPAAPLLMQTNGAEANATVPPSERAAYLAAMLNEEGNELVRLNDDEIAVVSDLSVNPNLPKEWLNVLLLGSDERTDEESARTDSMIICSIQLETGEVKLTSIMRDLAVDFDELGDLNGTYRINAANYFGGEALAMKVVNECFDLNIENYVRVNFFGFQQIAALLGGIDVDITEEEMEQINHNIVEQYKFARRAGIDDSNLPKDYLTEFGTNTHLDGRQTLGYARIRKLDGGDYARAERQRTVLIKLMEKLKDADAVTLMNIATTALPYVKTNLSPSTIVNIATTVLTQGVDGVETFRLPINGTYTQDTREDQSMLYDCNWAQNSAELYSFIYG